MLPVSEAASWIALLIVSSDAPAPKSYPPYVRLAWRWFLQKRLRLSSPLSVLRLSILSATNDELCMAEPHSCQPVRHYSAICCSFSSRNDFYRKPPKCEFGLQPFGTPICVICTPKDTRNLPPNACSFASVPRQSMNAIFFMSLMRWQQKSHAHEKSTHSLGHLNRHQTQQELNGVRATIRVTIST